MGRLDFPCLEMCAGHSIDLGGESPLWAESNRSISLGKGVFCEEESEGSRKDCYARC